MRATAESLQLSYSPIPPLKVETLERLVIFNWDQVSSSFDVLIHDIALTISDVWPWSVFWSARNRIEYCLITPADIYSMVIELSTQYLPPSNGWSVWTNTRRLCFWPGELGMQTLQRRYAIPRSIFLGATAGVFSSHSYHFDAIWFYLSRLSTGEAFHLWGIIYISLLS